MKQIFIEYGGAILAIIGAFSFLVAFGQFFVGPDGAIGRLMVHSIEEKSIIDHQAFDEHQNDLPPTITSKEVYTIMVNERVNLSDCFDAKSAQGEVLPVCLMGAWDLDGNERDMGVSEDKRSICVPATGVYMIQVYAVDSMGKTTCRLRKLLVNEG